MALDVLPLLIAAAVVGIIHMSAPDHWMTICILGRTSKWSKGKLFGVSLATGLGHVVLSIALGLGIVAVGLVFSRLISFYFSLGIGAIMLVIGLFIGIKSLFKKNIPTINQEIEREENKIVNKRRGFRGVGYFAVLGAALSPDLSITPVFIASIPAGIFFALYLSLVFALASILCLVVLVQAGTMGLAKTFERIPEKYNDSIIGFVIAAIGIYIILAG